MCPDRLDSPTCRRSPAVIRVLHLVSTFQIKTDTNWLLQLIGHLPHDRFNTAVACMYGGGEMAAKFADMGIPTFNLDADREISPGGLVRLCRLLRTLAPHVLHTHLLRADLYGGLAGRLMGVPVILTSVYAIGAYRRAKVRKSDRVLDILCRHSATDALAVSNAVRDDMIASVGWPRSRVSVIHTGLAFSEQPPGPADRAQARAALGLTDHTPLVLTVARLSYEKGIDVLISAAGRVRQRIPEARFVVLGDGPLRESLQAQIRATGLEGVVELAGFRPDVAAVLPGGDLFVLPSLMEGMPNAVLEAHNAGLPVIATAVGGLPEIVRDGATGLLVRPGDPEDLARAIVCLLEDRSWRCRLAEQGRAAASQRFAVRRVAEQYAALYERLYRTRVRASISATRVSGNWSIANPDDLLPEPVDICGFGVRPVDQGQLIRALVERARRRIRTRAHYLNAHTFNLSLGDASFRKILATADLLYADGMSIVWAAGLLGRPLPERLSAADYFEAFCGECAGRGVKLYFLGGLEGVAQAAASLMTSRISGLRVVGAESGHFGEQDSAAVVSRINAAGPDLLLVGMGSPRQENWVARHADELAVPVCWTVGALFDYFAGREPRAPAWLCRHGGEWIYRLLHQPRHRWQRYLLGNARFAWAVIGEWLNGGRTRRRDP